LIQDGDDSKHLMDFLRTCTRHKSDMVGYEAAAAIVNLKNQPSDSLKAAVSVLQLFLASSKAVLRYAAVRTLNMVGFVFRCFLYLQKNMSFLCLSLSKNVISG